MSHNSSPPGPTSPNSPPSRQCPPIPLLLGQCLTIPLHPNQCLPSPLLPSQCLPTHLLTGNVSQFPSSQVNVCQLASCQVNVTNHAQARPVIFSCYKTPLLTVSRWVPTYTCCLSPRGYSLHLTWTWSCYRHINQQILFMTLCWGDAVSPFGLNFDKHGYPVRAHKYLEILENHLNSMKSLVIGSNVSEKQGCVEATF